MSHPSDLLDSVERVANLLNSVGIPYHFTGGLSVTVWGFPRSTQDIDVVVKSEKLSEQLATFVEVANKTFFVDQMQIAEALQRSGMFQLIDKINSFKVDVYAREAVPNELDRSVLVELSTKVKVSLVSQFDAILSKLIWISKGSHHSRRDVKWMFNSLDEEKKMQLYQQAQALNLDRLLLKVIDEQEPVE